MYNITNPAETLYPNTTTTLTSSNLSNSNWTFEDVKKINDAKAEALIPAMLVIGIYMIVGITGNLIVCYIMGFKLKKNTQNSLIIYLAVFDLLNCVICMPADICDMRYYFYFPSEIGCKIVRMFMSFTSEASIFALLVIAVDRFRKICRPMKRQMGRRHTKRVLVAVLAGAAFLSWPALIIFGFRTIQTGIPGIPGHDCSISNSLKGTLYPLVYTSTLFLLFIVICTCLIVLYSLVLAAARRHRQYMSSNSAPNHFTCSSFRGKTYAKNNNSVSATMTTEDTSASKESCESLCRVDRANVNSKKGYPTVVKGGVWSKMSGCVRGSGEKSSYSCRKLNQSEERSSNKNAQLAGIPDCDENDICPIEIDTEGEAGSISIISMHRLDVSLSQKLETASLDSIETSGQNENIPTLTDRNSPSYFPKHQRSNNTNEQNFNKESGSIDNETLTNMAMENARDPKTENGSVQLLDKNRDNGAMCEKNMNPNKSKSLSRKNVQDSSIVNGSTSDDEIIGGEHRKKKKNSRKISKLDHKTTMIAFCVTLVFILSYLPYLSLQISKQIFVGMDYDLQGAPLVLYNIFLRSYYINSIANPIIYGYLNNRFRHELRVLLSNMLCRT